MRSIAIACGHTIDHTPGADVAAGDVLVFGDLVAVADRPLKSGELGALAVDGLRSFPKAVGAGTDLTVGTPVYWDAANQVVTAIAGLTSLVIIGVGTGIVRTVLRDYGFRLDRTDFGRISAVICQVFRVSVRFCL